MARFCWYSCIYTRGFADRALSARGYAFFGVPRGHSCAIQVFPVTWGWGTERRTQGCEKKWDVEVPTGSWAGVVPEFPLPHPLVSSIPAQCVWLCHLPAPVILGMENRVLLALQISLAQWLHPIESRKSCADQKTTSTAYSVITFNIYAVPAYELEIISVTIGKERQEFQRA